MSKIILPLALLLAIITSCEDLLEVPDISEQEVQLLAPLDSSIVSDTVVNFNWNSIVEANSYVIQVATPNFENASQYVLDSIMPVDSTFVGAKFSKSLSSGNYEWRVKAMNSDYETVFSNSEFSVEN